MGTKLVNTRVKEESTDFPSIPPGFESRVPFTLKKVEANETPEFEALAPFTLKKVEANESKARYSPATASDLVNVKMETEFESSDDAKKSLRRRPWMNCGQLDNSSGEESDSEQNFPLRARLPKGVIRGCEQCSNCQKVTAKWRPEEARRPKIEDAPVFYPTEEEFEDTLNYMASIRSTAEAYGICRIVPPPSWKPPCPLKDKKVWESSKFNTRIQRIDKLQKRNSVKKLLKINPYNKSKKRRRCTKNGSEHGNGNGEIKVPVEALNYEGETFGFEPGPVTTLEAFQKYADDFKAQYFRKNEYISDTGVHTKNSQAQWEPSVEDIEGEYWRMVEKPTEEIEVLYGADIETGVFGSGFPKYSHQVGSTTDMKYVNSGWNLNNFPRLPGSVLSYESDDISGVLVPWLYIGMCFSSFCWHVEDHHLYSLNYMHWGAPKLWYGVPGADALKLEAAMRKHLPDLFEEQPDLLHKLVTQLSPSILKTEGVPVYRCVQNPGEFVLTFPRAYHAGFNSGFNCAEAVNVAPVDWLLHGQNAIELYRVQARRTSISHDKLLLGAARDAVKAHWEMNLLRKNTGNNLRWRDVCGKDGILFKALKTRVEMERVRREFLCKSSKAMKMESTFDASSERECSVCLFDLHLSAAGCHNCSPDKYACLDHAKQLCSCSWGVKFFLFRYDIIELNILADALEGKLGAVYRWAKLDLGLDLSSAICRENSLVSVLSGKLSGRPGLAAKDTSSLLASASVKEQKEKAEMEKPAGGLLAFGGMDASFMLQKPSQEGEAAKPGRDCKEILQSVSGLKTLPSQPPQDEFTQKIALGTAGVKQSSFHGDVIILSDDEGEEPSKPPPERPKDSSVKHVAHSDDMVSPSSRVNNPVATTTTTSMAVMGELTNCSSSSACTKVEASSHGETHFDHSTCESHHGPNAQKHSSLGLSSSDINFDSRLQNHSNTKEATDSNMENPGIYFQNLLPSDGGKSYNGDSQKTLDSDANSRIMNNMQTTSNHPSGSHNNLDRYYRQKGPRIAKVVRRINCHVEPLEFGAVQRGELWCDSRAIYPKGFRSRVKYINAVDPTDMCHYVSEILDAGRGPLFMVSLEHLPSEVFVHTSVTRCWEMVRERVNQEIAKQHKLGRLKLHPLQPPGSLDGMEMFGFSSPAIVQVIQAMDKNRVCTEYWKSRPLMQIPQHSESADNASNISTRSEMSNGNAGLLVPAGTDTILNGLFKKANPEELHALYSSLSSNGSIPNREGSVIWLLKEEIHKRSNVQGNNSLSGLDLA